MKRILETNECQGDAARAQIHDEAQAIRNDSDNNTVVSANTTFDQKAAAAIGNSSTGYLTADQWNGLSTTKYDENTQTAAAWVKGAEQSNSPYQSGLIASALNTVTNGVPQLASNYIPNTAIVSAPSIWDNTKAILQDVGKNWADRYNAAKEYYIAGVTAGIGMPGYVGPSRADAGAVFDMTMANAGGELVGGAVGSAVKVTKGASNAAEQLSRESVVDKLNRYLLNPNHSVGGSKAKWFKEALGFTNDNSDALANQIVFDTTKAVQTGVTEFGTKYNQIISITGANGNTIDVTFAWIKNNDGVVRLVTGIPTNK